MKISKSNPHARFQEIVRELRAHDDDPEHQINEATALAIAANYASPGSVGNKIAQFVTTGECDTTELLEDIQWTMFQMPEKGVYRELSALCDYIMWHSDDYTP